MGQTALPPPVPVPAATTPPGGTRPGEIPLAGSVPPASPPAAPARDNLPKLSKPFRVPPGVIALIGYVTSAIVGLGLGWLVLSFIRPDVFRIPW
jgi:hypothetical protein